MCLVNRAVAIGGENAPLGLPSASQVAIQVANYDQLLPHRWETYIAPDSSLRIEVSGKPAVETTHAPIEGSRATRMTLVVVEPSNGTLMCVAGNGATGRR